MIVKRLVTPLLLTFLTILVGLAPLLIVESSYALPQMTSRSVTISTAEPAATGVTYAYGFTTQTTSFIQSVSFQACVDALGSCTAPTGMNINLGSATLGTGWSNATAFSRSGSASAANCTAANNMLCITRTNANNETAGARTISVSGQTNPDATNCSSNPNCTFFLRIVTYSDTAWVTPVDYGTVASSTTQTLTVNAAVAEILNFCVGSTTVNDTSFSPGATCANISGTSVNLGTLDSASVTVTPVTAGATCNAADCGTNGIAMLRTNAVHGATVSYKAIQQSGTNHQGTLRVSGDTCNAGTVNTDPCINAHGGTQSAFSAGAEDFGMTIAGVNCGSSQAYSCDYVTSGDNHLQPDAQYDGDGFTPSAANTFGTTQGFAWDETGSTAAQIASTASVVDDEALILKFAATPSITTPTGAYTAQATFIVVPAY